MQCPVCHNEVPAQNAFCNHCGASLASAAPQQPAYQPVQQPAYTPVQQQGYTAPPPGGGYQPPPPPPGGGYTAQPGGYAPQPGAGAASAGGLSDNMAAAIAYITIIPAILFLILEPYNKSPLVRFHSFQNILLCVSWIVVWIAVTVLHVILHFIPLIGLLWILVDLALGLGFFLAWLMCIIKASKGEYFKLPFIGDFAEKQARG
jgi:uncharacterized membrane protein